MTMGRIALGVAPLALLLSGCLPEEPAGYVEVKRVFTPASGKDIYRLNGEELTGLRGFDASASVVVKQKAGNIKLELYRDDSHWLLCKFDLSKNRIVTATIYLQNRDIKCSVQS